MIIKNFLKKFLEFWFFLKEYWIIFIINFIGHAFLWMKLKDMTNG
jgi:hypothetical protein